MNSQAPPAAEWTRRSERGSVALLRFMVWASLTVGRAPARILLRLIALYFLATAAGPRRASRQYLTRCLGRAPRLAELYRLFFSFASTVHDRVYFLKDRFELFDIETHGIEHFDEHGMLLMGAHFGSFEVLRDCGKRTGHRHVAMAMYAENARKISAALAALDPAAMMDIVELGRMNSMLLLRDRLDEGALAGVLADRTFGGEAVLHVPFLGVPAPFPTGPMRMAAALRRRVLFMSGTYRGGNRYEIVFEPLADFTDLAGLTRAERTRQVEDAVTAYAKRLEKCALDAPFNWFNFHDFWGPSR